MLQHFLVKLGGHFIYIGTIVHAIGIFVALLFPATGVLFGKNVLFHM